MSIEFLSTVPELPKTVLSGDGLTTAVAGKRTPISIRLFDQFDNPATPPPAWTVGLAITNSNKKLNDIEAHADISGHWSGTPGEHTLQDVARQATLTRRSLPPPTLT